MTVSVNTIVAKDLGDFCVFPGKKGLNVSKFGKKYFQKSRTSS